MSWSFSASIICFSKKIALFKFLTISQLVGGALGLIIERKSLQFQDVVKHLKNNWFFVLLLLANFIAYPLAFRNAPAAHVDLITYLWPTMFVLGEVIRTKKPLSLLQGLGTVLCLLALIVLLYPSLLSTCQFNSRYILGYIVGFLSALSWTLYNILSKALSRTSYKSTAIDIFYSGIICAFVQVIKGDYHMPDFTSLMVIVCLGVFVYGIAFPCWNRALQLGQHTLISGMASAIPIFSVMWLIITGFSRPSFYLLISFLLVGIGCFCLAQTKASLQAK